MQLYGTTRLGKLNLKNRIVMAPMTRSRAVGNIPNALMAEYYSQRASAGLIITEGTSPSPNGLGYARIPGLFNVEQAQAWRQVTDAVHAKGGKIFVQLMHTGRISHPLNMPATAKILAPSAIAAKGQMWTDSQGLQPHPVPLEMTLQDIEQAVGEFVTSAKLAVEVAGFDGVELHGANGYLIEQFLNPGSNQRTDSYGQDRKLFALQVAAAVAKAIGPEKTGIRISPYGTFNDVVVFEGVDQFYQELSSKLSEIGLLYIHVVDHKKGNVKELVRKSFAGAYILSTGYDVVRAEEDLTAGRGDLVAFGIPFIANPDFVEKALNGLPLKAPDAAKFYTPGAEGYTDYI